MRQRILGLVGIIVCGVVAYLAWKYLSGGQGLMRNVARNAVLTGMIPGALYSLRLLFGSSRKQPPVGSKTPDTTSSPTGNSN